jgi:hypothetical protein
MTVASIILLEPGASAAVFVLDTRVTLFVIRVGNDAMGPFRLLPSAIDCPPGCLPSRAL